MSLKNQDPAGSHCTCCPTSTSTIWGNPTCILRGWLHVSLWFEGSSSPGPSSSHGPMVRSAFAGPMPVPTYPGSALNNDTYNMLIIDLPPDRRSAAKLGSANARQAWSHGNTNGDKSVRVNMSWSRKGQAPFLCPPRPSLSGQTGGLRLHKGTSSLLFIPRAALQLVWVSSPDL